MTLLITPAEWHTIHSVNGNPTATSVIFDLIADPSNSVYLVDAIDSNQRTHRIVIQAGNLTALLLG
jgi:hypothetical protein